MDIKHDDMLGTEIDRELISRVLTKGLKEAPAKSMQQRWEEFTDRFLEVAEWIVHTLIGVGIGLVTVGLGIIFLAALKFSFKYLIGA